MEQRPKAAASSEELLWTDLYRVGEAVAILNEQMLELHEEFIQMKKDACDFVTLEQAVELIETAVVID